MVGPGERGVTLLFGRVVGQTEPGLRYRAPRPIQQHHVVDVSTVRRAEVGFRAEGGSTRTVPGEALMLTGDENVFSPDTTMVLRPDSDLLRYPNSPRERRWEAAPPGQSDQKLPADPGRGPPAARAGPAGRDIRIPVPIG